MKKSSNLQKSFLVETISEIISKNINQLIKAIIIYNKWLIQELDAKIV